MSRDYRPRRAPHRFLEGAPRELIAVYDNGGKTFDRYTAVFDDVSVYDGRTWIAYRGMSEDPYSPQGFGISDSMQVHQMQDYRRRAYREYVAFGSLPAPVKRSIVSDCTAIAESRTA